MVRADMAAALEAEFRRRGLADRPGADRPRKLPAGLRVFALGAAGGLAWGTLLGLGLMGVL